MAPYLSKEQTKEAASLEYGKEPGRLMKDRLPAFEALLCSRGFKTKEEQERFLYPRLEDLQDPMKLMDMDRAVKRILLAKNKGEGVLIYGDYDADGITSTALLKQYLMGLGMKVQTYIPNRLSEGYGMSRTVIDGYLDGDVGLIVTVDTGSTAAREIAYAAEHGIETVVTDHHECVGELPCCVAVVNPMRPDSAYPFGGLSGVGVVFKLVCAIESQISGEDHFTVGGRMLSLYGDLVALGTVADVMPMLDENRYIVRRGMMALDEGKNKGLCALCGKIGVAGKKATATTLGYSVAPHINAAGRMGHAECALALLLSESFAKADLLAGQLCAYNQQRKSEEQIIFEEAEEMILSGDCRQDEILVLYKDGWHPGVLGIVAARITEKYQKPSVLISFEGDEGKGSCRSLPGMDLVELLSRVKDYTEKFGGHELAAGVTVKREKIALFAEQLLLEARRMTRQEAKTGEEKKPDMTLSALDLSLPFAKAVELLEPFGEGNPVPLFLIKDVQIESVVPLSLGKHTKLLVKKAELFFTALLFSQKTALFPYVEGDTVDLVFELSVNEYLKKQSVQLLVRRIIPAGETLQELLKSKEGTEKLLNNESVAVTPPEREHFARVYTALRQYEKSGQNAFSLRILSLKAGCASLAQCLLILLIFEEQSLLLLERETGGEDCFRFRLLPTEKKADLERSELLKRFTKLP